MSILTAGLGPVAPSPALLVTRGLVPGAAAPPPDFLAALLAYLRASPALSAAGLAYVGTAANVATPYPMLLVNRLHGMDLPTNSPTTAWVSETYQYTLFAQDAPDGSARGEDRAADLGHLAYQALRPQLAGLSYAGGVEFLRNRTRPMGPTEEAFDSARGGLPTWRVQFDVEHQMSELLSDT